MTTTAASRLSRLTARDRLICQVLAEHRVLTTDQVATLAFDSTITAQHRLATLYSLSVIDRFRPVARRGSFPIHCTLGPLGALVVATETGTTPPTAAALRRQTAALAASPGLSHLVATNGFFVALAGHARQTPGAVLHSWWSERRCEATFGAYVRPDGYGVFAAGSRRREFFVEIDRGTETHRRLVAKADDYRALAAAEGRPRWVLFSFSSAGRETAARRALGHLSGPVATTHVGLGSPAGAVWLVIGAAGDAQRVGMVELSGAGGAQ